MVYLNADDIWHVVYIIFMNNELELWYLKDQPNTLPKENWMLIYEHHFCFPYSSWGGVIGCLTKHRQEMNPGIKT